MLSRIPHFFFSTDTATTWIYTLSLHDALPISEAERRRAGQGVGAREVLVQLESAAYRLHGVGDRKSTRLNSSHITISYAVFCLKKKNQKQKARVTSSSANILIKSIMILLYITI